MYASGWGTEKSKRLGINGSMPFGWLERIGKLVKPRDWCGKSQGNLGRTWRFHRDVFFVILSDGSLMISWSSWVYAWGNFPVRNTCGWEGHHGDFQTRTVDAFLQSDHHGWLSQQGWLVVWLPFFIFPLTLGISSSQLTFIFFRGVQTTNHQPEGIFPSL